MEGEAYGKKLQQLHGKKTQFSGTCLLKKYKYPPEGMADTLETRGFLAAEKPAPYGHEHYGGNPGGGSGELPDHGRD